MAICQWKDCGKEFTPIQKHQKFCSGGKCREAYNNWRKLTGIHLLPELYEYVKSVADEIGIPVDAQANIMIAKVANPDGQPLDDDALYGKPKDTP